MMHAWRSDHPHPLPSPASGRGEVIVMLARELARLNKKWRVIVALDVAARFPHPLPSPAGGRGGVIVALRATS